MKETKEKTPTSAIIRIVLTTVLTLTISCSRRHSSRDCIGTYRCDWSNGYEMLALVKDGTYTHICVYKNGVFSNSSGAWTFVNEKKIIPGFSRAVKRSIEF